MPVHERKFKILLVEDDPADAYLAELAFQEAAIEVELQHARDGLEALAALRQQGPFAGQARADLVLLDMNMPHMDGRGFLSAVKADAALSMIPVVVLTTSNAERDVVAAYSGHASGYVVKPIELDDFVNRLRELTQYWMKTVRLPEY